MGTDAPLTAALFQTGEFIALLGMNSVLVFGAIALGGVARPARVAGLPGAYLPRHNGAARSDTAN